MLMKFKSIITLCLLLGLGHSLLSQNSKNYFQESLYPTQNDSLIILRKDGQKIKMTWPYKINVKKRVAWEELIDAFQTDLSKVIDDIPDYDFYEINYYQNSKLTIDEITGKEIYTVNELRGYDHIRSNKCRLNGRNVQLSIEFSDKSELVDSTLKQELVSAIAQIKNMFYISAITPERHYYSAESNSQLPLPKPKFRFFLPSGARAGFVVNRPYIDLRIGPGLQVGDHGFFSLMYNAMTTYNSTSARTEYDHFIGLSSGAFGSGLRSEVAFKVNDGREGDLTDFRIRTGLSYSTRNGIVLGAEYYIGDTQRDSNGYIFGAHIGIGF